MAHQVAPEARVVVDVGLRQAHVVVVDLRLLDGLQKAAHDHRILVHPRQLALLDEALQLRVGAKPGHDAVVDELHVGVDVLLGLEELVAVLVEDPVLEVGELHGQAEQAHVELARLVERGREGPLHLRDVVLRGQEVDERAVHHVFHPLEALESVVVALGDEGRHLGRSRDDDVEQVAPQVLLARADLVARILEVFLIEARLLDAFGHRGHRALELERLGSVTAQQRADRVVEKKAGDKPRGSQRRVSGTAFDCVGHSDEEHQHVQI